MQRPLQPPPPELSTDSGEDKKPGLDETAIRLNLNLGWPPSQSSMRNTNTWASVRANIFHGMFAATLLLGGSLEFTKFPHLQISGFKESPKKWSKWITKREPIFFWRKVKNLGDLGDAVSAPISKDPGGSAPQTLAWGSAVLICFGRKGGGGWPSLDSATQNGLQHLPINHPLPPNSPPINPCHLNPLRGRPSNTLLKRKKGVQGSLVATNALNENFGRKRHENVIFGNPSSPHHLVH